MDSYVVRFTLNHACCGSNRRNSVFRKLMHFYLGVVQSANSEILVFSGTTPMGRLFQVGVCMVPKFQLNTANISRSLPQIFL